MENPTVSAEAYCFSLATSTRRFIGGGCEYEYPEPLPTVASDPSIVEDDAVVENSVSTETVAETKSRLRKWRCSSRKCFKSAGSPQWLAAHFNVQVTGTW
jgi:hypothetical protein